MRYAGGGLRGAHLGVHGDLRRAGHPQDRPVPIPVRHKVGLHGGPAAVRHPALYPVQHLRHAGRCHHRCAHRPADGGVPLQGRRPQAAHRGGHRHRAAVRHPQRSVRPFGYAGAGARRGKDLRQGLRCLPAQRYRGAFHHDLTQHRVRVGDGAQRRAAGV